MNIFENSMDSFEFTDAIAEKIATDWGHENADPCNLYCWIRDGFAESLVNAVRKKVEG